MKVIVYGYGLMGKKVVSAVDKDKDMELVGVVSPFFDEQPTVASFKSLRECNIESDAIIDFSNPNNLDDILCYALKYKLALVLATTGFSEEQLESIKEASKQIPIFQSYNTSFGISKLTQIVKSVVKEFYDANFDIEILEKHHNQKVDAPSGTAKLLYDVIDEEIDAKAIYDRSSIKHKRERNEVGISSIRGGTIFGEHSVFFAGNDEIIEIKHTALSKEVFVQGALQALKAIIDKDNGLYNLKNLY